MSTITLCPSNWWPPALYSYQVEEPTECTSLPYPPTKSRSLPYPPPKGGYGGGGRTPPKTDSTYTPDHRRGILEIGPKVP